MFVLRLKSKLCIASAIGLCFFFAGFSEAVLAQAESGKQEPNQQQSKPEFTETQIEFFEQKVRPILVEHCYECHGPEAEHLDGGLSLGSRKNILKGGDNGPAINLDEASKSLLLDAINYGENYQMPPSGKLPPEKIAILTDWIRQGSPWPTESDEEVVREKFDLEARRDSHWCWQPIQKIPAPNETKANHFSNPIDRFVEAERAKKGLTAAPLAARETLIRRVCFDLTGLPPSAAQLKKFLADPAEHAFETLVDELLADPAFGEHWARHWMDLVRYAETLGHEFDYVLPDAFEYRDYVIRAFNANVPYDQWVREHIAGDLLIEPRLHPDEKFNESLIGTGFWFLGEAVHGPVDVREDEAMRIDNQIDVMTKTFLGVTVACARCHDHKFDAISAEDYYALAGFLQSSRRQRGMLDPENKIRAGYEKATELSGEADQKLQDWLSAVDLEKAEIIPRLDAYFQAAIEIARQLESAEKIAEQDERIKTVALEKQLEAGLVRKLVVALKQLPTHDKQVGLFQLFGLATNPEHELNDQLLKQVREQIDEEIEREDEFQSDSKRFTKFAGVVPEGWFSLGPALEDQKALPSNKPAEKQNRFASVGPAIRSRTSIDSGIHGSKFCGVLYSPTFTIEHDKIHLLVRGSNVYVRLIIDGFVMDVYNALLFADASKKIDIPNEYVWLTMAGDIKNYKGHKAHLEIIDHGDEWFEVSEIRFSDNAKPPAHPVIGASPIFEQLTEATFDKVGALVAEQFRHELKNGSQSILPWLIENDLTDLFPPSPSPSPSSTSTQSSPDQPSSTPTGLIAELKKLRQSITLINQETPHPRWVLAMTDGTAENQNVFIRGSHKSPGDIAIRRFLSAISHQPISPANGSGRRELAEKILEPQNPLTARVMVNRIWHHLMGRGIVSSVDNLGVLGEAPTHPELLDYLAAEFIDDGWNIKQLIRRIVMSETYQMSSQPNPASSEIDPQNLLLHRANLKRLSGESIRDAILQISGRLDRTMFGPSVPVHLTANMDGRGKPGHNGPLDGNGRRSIYVEIRRNFLSPMMLAFDTPIPFNAAGKRNQSNVPAQALIMLNDPFVIDQTTNWSRRLLAIEESTEQRIERIFLESLSRPPTQTEKTQAIEFLQAQSKLHGIEFRQTPSEQQGIEPSAAFAHDAIWKDFCHLIVNLKEFRFVK